VHPLRIARHADERYVKLPGHQVFDELVFAGIAQLHLRGGNRTVQTLEKRHEVGRAKGAHDTESQRRRLQRLIAVRFASRCFARGDEPFQMRPHQPPQVRQVRPRPFPAQQLSAQLFFEFLYGASQGRRRDVAMLRRLGEVEAFTDGQKISDLTHFMVDTPSGRSRSFHERPRPTSYTQAMKLIGSWHFKSCRDFVNLSWPLGALR
jgi:hypothetical protein